MKHILLYLAVFITLVSCGTEYLVEGHTTVQTMDGKKMYLKVYRDDDLVDIDSSEVVHGKFGFNGSLDSVMMVNLFMDDESLMPLVLGEEKLTVYIDPAKQYVTGSVLNDTLYEFIRKKSRIDNELAELPHKESQMIMDGVDENLIMIRLEDELGRLSAEQDRLVTSFITSNFDNVLGTGVFMIMTSGYPYPVLTPQIEEIMTKATPYFKSNEYVRRYMEAAKENMHQMGMGYDTETTDSIPE